MKVIFVSQSNYLPWVGYFESIAAADEYWIYDIVQYTRRDWRNRNRIKSKNGLQWLSVPIQQHTQQTAVDQVKVANSNWREKHLHALQSTYGKAPYFDWVMEQLTPGLLTDTSSLSIINEALIKICLSFLDISTSVHRVDNSALMALEKTARLVAICQATDATHYLTGPAARHYIDASLFTAAGIELCYINYPAYPAYAQYAPPFTAQVSIVDVLMHLGPAARDYLVHRSDRQKLWQP